MRKFITDTTKMQRLIRDHYQQLNADNLDNLEDRDKFLETFNLPRLNNKEIEN